MKGWQLDGLGGPFRYIDLPQPQARPGSVVVRLEASALMSYMQDYVDGALPIYRPPRRPFVPGGNGIGVIHSVGADVWHLQAGERVAISSHLVARENVRAPGSILLGVTGQGDVAERMQADWPDGTLAQYVVVPASLVTPVHDLDQVSAPLLAVSMRYLVPFGGLLRGRLAAGETLVISGATGAYGSAAMFVALAMGAAHVVLLGRDRAKLARLVATGGNRVTAVATTGDPEKDARRVREATAGGADMAFDMVGGATDPHMTLAALRSLSDGGRLVLMGSMTVPLPLPYVETMLHGWEIIGNFMYPRDAYRRLLDLFRAGLLDPAAIEPRIFPLAALHDAMRAARSADSLECVVLDHTGE
jgi:alcohol dehydrogenase